jgi:hypothetical protein
VRGQLLFCFLAWLFRAFSTFVFMPSRSCILLSEVHQFGPLSSCLSRALGCLCLCFVYPAQLSLFWILLESIFDSRIVLSRPASALFHKTSTSLWISFPQIVSIERYLRIIDFWDKVYPSDASFKVSRAISSFLGSTQSPPSSQSLYEPV